MTGAAEPHTAEQAGLGGPQVVGGRLCAVLEAPAVVAGLDDVAVVSEAIRLRRKLKGKQRSLREVASALAEQGYVNSNGKVFSAAAIKSMIERSYRWTDPHPFSLRNIKRSAGVAAP